MGSATCRGHDVCPYRFGNFVMNSHAKCILGMVLLMFGITHRPFGLTHVFKYLIFSGRQVPESSGKVKLRCKKSQVREGFELDCP